MSRDVFEKLERITAKHKLEEKEQARFKTGYKKKAKKTRHVPKTVKCALCQKDVKGEDTADTPIGPACKSHPGVE